MTLRSFIAATKMLRCGSKSLLAVYIAAFAIVATTSIETANKTSTKTSIQTSIKTSSKTSNSIKTSTKTSIKSSTKTSGRSTRLSGGGNSFIATTKDHGTKDHRTKASPLAGNSMVQKLLGYLEQLSTEASQQLDGRTALFQTTDAELAQSLEAQEKIFGSSNATLIAAEATLVQAKTDLSDRADEQARLVTETKEARDTLEQKKSERKAENAEYRESLEKSGKFRSAVRTALEHFDAMDLGGNSTSSGVQDLRSMIEVLSQQALDELETLNGNEKLVETTFAAEKETLETQIDTAENRLNEIEEEQKELAAKIEAAKEEKQTASAMQTSSEELITSLQQEREKNEEEFTILDKELRAQASACQAAIDVFKSAGAAPTLTALQTGHQTAAYKSGAKRSSHAPLQVEPAMKSPLSLFTVAQQTVLSFPSIRAHRMFSTLQEAKRLYKQSKGGRKSVAEINYHNPPQQENNINIKSLLTTATTFSSKKQEEQKQPSYVEASLSGVVTMVRELIADLKAQNVEDMKAQEYCNKMLASDKQTLQSAKGILDWYVKMDDELRADVAELADSTQDATEAIAETKREIAERNVTFVTGQNMDSTTVAEALEAIPIVEEALLQLEGPEFINNKAIQGAIAMLDVVSEDLEKTVSETEAEMTEKQEEYYKIATDSLAALSGLQEEFTVQNETMWGKGSLLFTNELHHEPWASQKTEAAKKKLANSTRMCNVAEDYEARAAKRDSLLSSLKNALAMVEQQSAALTTSAALVQKKAAVVPREGKAVVLKQEKENKRSTYDALDAAEDEVMNLDFKQEIKHQRKIWEDKVAKKYKIADVDGLKEKATSQSTFGLKFLQRGQQQEKSAHKKEKTTSEKKQEPVDPTLVDNDPSTSPVNNVISLLQAVRSDVERDASADLDFIERMRHYCEVSKKEAQWQVENSDEEELLNKRDGITGTLATLALEISNFEADQDTQQARLKELSEVFEKERAELMKTEKELVESITALKGALTVLEKHTAGAASAGSAVLLFLQKAGLSFDSSLVEEVQRKLSGDGSLRTSSHDKKPLPSFLASTSSIATASTSSTSQHKGTGYNDAGADRVFGILSTMRETFEKQLEETRTALTKSNTEYAVLRTKKTEAVSALDSQLSEKRSSQSVNSLELSKIENQLAKAGNVLEEAKKTLFELEQSCAKENDEFAERDSARAEELAALDTTLQRLAGGNTEGTTGSTSADSTSENEGQVDLRLRNAEMKELAGNRGRGLTTTRGSSTGTAGTKRATSTVVNKIPSRFRSAVEDRAKDMIDGELGKNMNKQHKADMEKSIMTHASDVSGGALGTLIRGQKAVKDSTNNYMKTTSSTTKREDFKAQMRNAGRMMFSDDASTLQSKLEKKNKSRHGSGVRLKSSSSSSSSAKIVPSTARQRARRTATASTMTSSRIKNAHAGLQFLLQKQMQSQSPEQDQNTDLAFAMSLIVGKLDERVVEMKKQKKQEQLTHDKCVEEQQQAALALTEKTHLYDTTAGKLELSEGLAAFFPAKIEGKHNDVAELQGELESLGATMVEEEGDIKRKLEDDKDAASVLHSAIDELERFYGNPTVIEEGGMFGFLDTTSTTASTTVAPLESPDEEPGMPGPSATLGNSTVSKPPAPAKAYEKHQTGGSVVVLLKTMLDEVHATIDDDIARLDELRARYLKQKANLQGTNHALAKQLNTLQSESISANRTVTEQTAMRDDATDAENYE
ncbi:unnamed protein product, partial [Amoebophrya sp. A25]|eukprot:GSA25T00027443001.1